MRVLHITPSFYPARHYGGTSHSNYALCNATAALPDIELRVLTTDSDGPERHQRISVPEFPVHTPQGYDIWYCSRLLGADISFSMLWRLWPMIRWADVVHLSAVYSPPTIPTLLLCKLQGKPVVWSPRGALQRWRGSTHLSIKRIWELICDTLCSPDRVMLLATSDQEREESRKRITRATPIMVRNGIDIPRTEQAPAAAENKTRLLYLGRLHPIKGIENLLHALVLTDDAIELSICGDGEPEYRQSLERLSGELGLARRVTFHGLVEAEEKEQHFRRASICVVPSHKEAFCLVVAEALAHGVPVIVSSSAPWKEVNGMGCGLSVENDPQTLARAINDLLSRPLAEMGKRGREWMRSDYSWTVVAQRVAAHYREITRHRDIAVERKQLGQPSV